MLLRIPLASWPTWRPAEHDLNAGGDDDHSAVNCYPQTEAHAFVCNRPMHFGQRIALLLLSLVSSSNGDNDPIKNFCRLFGHSTAIVDREMFIDGGIVNWSPISTDSINYTSKALGEIPISCKDFDVFHSQAHRSSRVIWMI